MLTILNKYCIRREEKFYGKNKFFLYCGHEYMDFRYIDGIVYIHQTGMHQRKYITTFSDSEKLEQFILLIKD